MDLSVTTKVTMEFQVGVFYGTEGGMEYESFGGVCKTLQEAVVAWQLAELKHPKENWIIYTSPVQIIT